MKQKFIITTLILIITSTAFSGNRKLQTIHSVGDFDISTTEQLRNSLIVNATKYDVVKKALNRIKGRAENAIVLLEKLDKKNHKFLEEETSKQIFDLAICYVLSTEKKFKTAAITLFEKLILNVSFEVYLTGGAKPNSLKNKIWLIYLSKSYDILYNDFSIAEKQKFETWLKTMAAVVLKQKKWMFSKNTADGAWQAAAIGLIGSALDDEKIKNTSKNMVLYQFDKMIGKDGLWLEGSLDLHYAATAAFYIYANSDRSLFLMTDINEKNYLEEMAQAPLMFLDPFGMFPGDNSTKTMFPPGKIYIKAFRQFKKIEFGFIAHKEIVNLPDEIIVFDYSQKIKNGPIRAEPPYSIINSTFGLGILRTGIASPKDELFARLDYGQHGGSSGHADKLSLYFCGFGRRVTTDENTDDPILGFEWAKQTLAHNTVVINYQSQAGAKNDNDANGVPGKLLLFDRKAGIKIIEADAQNSYLDTPIKSYRRCVALTDKYFLDIFTVKAEKEVAADWVFHGLGKLFAFQNVTHGEKSLNNDVVRESLLGSNNNGYQWIENIETYTANDQWSIVWSCGLKSTFLACPKTRILIGNSGGEVERVGEIVTKRVHTDKTLIVRRININSTRFVAIHEILSSKLPIVKSFTKLETGKNILLLEITGDDFIDIFLLQPKHKIQKIMIDKKNLLITKPQRYAYIRIDKKTNKVISSSNARLEKVE